MISFLDVIRPLTDQLKTMSGLAGQASQAYTAGTTTFHNHVNDIGNLSSSIVFLGQGADAFVQTVNSNTTRSTKAIARLSDFQAACDDALSTMIEMSGPYDNQNLYLQGVPSVSEYTDAFPYKTYEFQYLLTAQGYIPSGSDDPRTIIVASIRDYTLPGLSNSLGVLLTPGAGKAQVETFIHSAVLGIQSSFQRYQAQRHDFLDAALRHEEIEEVEHSYYSVGVDEAYDIALGVVNAIATNMKTGYDSWDEELIAAANSFIINIENINLGNLTQFQLSSTIDSRFHDPRTQVLLYTMLGSPYGAKVVQYLLNVADCRSMSPCGDSLIVWQNGMPPNTGAFNDGTVITLNIQDFNGSYNPDDSATLATLGGYLAHEATETFYARACNIPGDTLPMDYLAGYVYQIVSNQIAGQPVGSYPNYQDWANPNNILVSAFHESNSPQGDLGEQIRSEWSSIVGDANPYFANNPMGLNPLLLQNNSTLPGWNISKYWDSATNSFHPPALIVPHPSPLPSPSPPSP